MATSELVSPTPSIAGLGHHATPVGRPLKSVVWNFFEHNVQIEKSNCQMIKPGPLILTDADQVCGHCNRLYLWKVSK